MVLQLQLLDTLKNSLQTNALDSSIGAAWHNNRNSLIHERILEVTSEHLNEPRALDKLVVRILLTIYIPDQVIDAKLLNPV